MITKIFSKSRYIVLIAVICSFVAAAALLILAGIETIQLVVKAFSINLDAKSIKSVAVTLIEVIDLLLLATVFYITSLGLYELFIDDQLPTPTWLHINHLDDLKSKLISVVVVILAVVFLGHAVNWDGGGSILILGAAVGLVIAAITFFLGWQGKKG